MAELAQYAGYYADIDCPIGDEPLQQTFRRLNRLDFVVFRPVLMALLARYDENRSDAFVGARALESFLVRRMVCDEQTRGYGTLALELVRVVRNVPAREVATPSLVDALRSGWPGDEAFHNNWRTRRFYGGFRRDRVAMILQALEERYQADRGKGEPLLPFDYFRLQIEHIMPQNWAANWPQLEGYSALERDSYVQNIGNLTLVSSKLNPSLSNSAWNLEGSPNCKSAQLAKHSDLKLNRKLLEERERGWDEEAIRRRADVLFTDARLIWPSADALA